MRAGGTRIHYVSHAAIPSAEANGLQVMKMCAALARRVDEVVLHCRAAGPLAGAHERYGITERFRIEGVGGPRVRLVGRALYSLRTVLRLRREAARAPDALLYGRDFHTLALAALLGTPDLPIVLEVHQPPQGRLERALLRTLLRSPRFRALVAISAALAREYERLYGPLLAGRVIVAHDGADLPRASSAPPDGDPPVLGYVGNLYPGKGMETIEALAGLLPDLRFRVVGGKPADVEHWRARITARNVEFTGFLPHAEAQERMRSCDVLLAPFRSRVLIGGDGTDIGRWMSPLKVFEYMASGRPMVASDLPVLREVLNHRGNAMLVPPDDVEAWARAVRELVDDPALRLALAERARADLARHYTWDRRTARILGELRGARAVPAGVPS